MNIFGLIKDIASVAQKADNLDLYKKLLDVSSMASEMKDELDRLKEENANLKKKNDLRPSIERHEESFITLKGSNPKLRYCSHCWDAEEKLIQLYCNEGSGRFECPHCKFDGIFDFEKYDATCHSSYLD